MHLAAGDNIDARHLLLQDGRLRSPQLRIKEVAGCDLSRNH